MMRIVDAEADLDGLEDGYEPIPNVFQQLYRIFVRIYRWIFREPTDWKWVGLSLFFAISLCFVFMKFGNYLPLRFRGGGRPPPIWRWDLSNHGFWYLLWQARWYGFWIIVLGPIWEESVFRGLPILFSRWLFARSSEMAVRVGISVLAVSTTLLFAWMHRPVIGYLPIPQLVLGGLAFAIAWRKGLRYSICLHSFANLITFITMMIWLYRAERLYER